MSLKIVLPELSCLCMCAYILPPCISFFSYAISCPIPQPAMLHVEVMLESDAALMGGDYEYDPFVKYSASWGKHRLTENSTALPIGEFLALPPLQLPPAQVSRLSGDEMLHLKLQTQSRHSGIASIDAQEKGQERYEVQDGKVMVPLADLLALHDQKGTLRLPVSDGPLFRALEAKLAQDEPNLPPKEREARATLASCKGILALRARVTQDAAPLQQALKQAVKLEQEGKRLIYGSPLFFRSLQKMQTLLLTDYSKGFYGQYRHDGTLAVPPKYALGREKTLQHMHMPLTPSEFGDMHSACMAQHRMEQRYRVSSSLILITCS